MAREVWKFNKFEGGLNTGTDAKDIKNNEFVEIVDCNISKVGVIKSLGHSRKTLEIPATYALDDIIPGEGLFHYFSDYTYASLDENHNTINHVGTFPAYDSSAASIELQTRGTMLWTFRGNPTGGELRLSVQVYNNSTDTWHPIHGEVGATSGSYLTVLKGSDFTTLGASSIATDVNLFNDYTYYHYPENDGEIPSSGASGNLYPATIWADNNLPNNIDYWANNPEATCTPGQRSMNIGTGSSYYPDGNYYLSQNSPNLYSGIHTVNPAEDYDYWFSAAHRPGINSIDSQYDSDDYYYFNDNRWLTNSFIYLPIDKINVDVEPYYVLGYSEDLDWDWDDLDTDQVAYIPLGTDFSDLGIDNEPGPLVGFPYLNPSDAGLSNATKGTKLVALSVWSNIIQAINKFEGSDYRDQFTAEFGNYAYPKNDGTAGVNNVVHYTDSFQDTVVLKSNEDERLNGGKVRVVLTTSGITPADGSELITEVNNRTFVSGSGVDWTEYSPDAAAATVAHQTNKLAVTGTSDTDPQGAKLTFENITNEELEAGKHYKLSADIYSSSGNIEGFRMAIGPSDELDDQWRTDKFDITDSSQTFTRDIFYVHAGTGENALIKIYAENNSTTKWYIDNVSLKECTVTYIGDDETFYDTEMIVSGVSTQDGRIVISNNDSKKLWIGRAIKFPPSLTSYSNTYYIHSVEWQEDTSEVMLSLIKFNDNGTYDYNVDYSSVPVGTRIYMQKIFPKHADTVTGQHQYNGNIEDSIYFRQYGSGFVRDGMDRVFSGGVTVQEKQTYYLFFDGPDYTSDTLFIDYQFGGSSTVFNVPGQPFLFTGSLETNVGVVKDALNSISGLTATTNGPELIKHATNRTGNPLDTQNTSFSFSYSMWANWQADGNSNLYRDMIEGADGRLAMALRDYSNVTTGGGAELVSAGGYNAYTDTSSADLIIDTEQSSYITSLNALKNSTRYRVTVDLKHDIDSANSLATYHVSLGGEECVAFPITVGWITYTKEITTAGDISALIESQANLKIYNKNDYFSEDYYWYIDNVSIVEVSTGNTITVQSDVAGTAGDFTISAYMSQFEFGAGGLVNQGVSEEFIVNIHESGVTPGDWWTDPGDGNTYYQTYFNLYSKLSNFWIPGIQEDLKWVYTGERKNKPTLWSESSRLRLFDANFNLDNTPQMFDYFDISQWFPNIYYTSSADASVTIVPLTNWSWESTVGVDDIQGFLSSSVIVSNEKIWNHSIIDSTTRYPTRGIFVNSDDTGDAWCHPDNFAEFPTMRLKFENDAPVADVDIHNDDNNGIDWIGITHFYAAAVYDDGGESLPAHKFSSELLFVANETEELVSTLKVHVAMRPVASGVLTFKDKNITGIRLYYTHSEEGHETFWSLGLIDFRSGFIKANIVKTADDTTGNEDPIVWQDLSTNVISLHDTSGITDFTVDDCTLDSTIAVDSFTASKINIGQVVTGDNIVDGTVVASITAGTEGLDVTAITLSIAATDTGAGRSLTFQERFIRFKSMPKLDTFDAINGYSPYDITTHVRYKSHCIAGRRSFIGNLVISDIDGKKYKNDSMIVSPVNQLDTFPYPGNVLDLDISDGDEIITLASVGDKVLEFKKNILYIMDISTGIAAEFFVESRHKFKGCVDKNHVVEVPDGIFWVNQFGAFMYDGEEVKDLHLKGDEGEKNKLISEEEWSNFFSGGTNLVGYNPKSRECFVVRKSTHNIPSDGDCYVYSLITESWVFGDRKFYCGSGKKITNFINRGNNSTLSFLYNGHFGEDSSTDGSPQ